MSSIQWKEPPKQGKGVWVRVLEPLKEKPGEWALISKTPTPTRAYNLHGLLTRRKLLVPEGEWEFKSTKTDNGGEVYARYLGTAKSEPVAVTTG